MCFIDIHKSNAFKDYCSFRLLDKGTFSTVYTAVYRKTLTRVAIKQVYKSSLNSDLLQRNIQREISILKRVDHPFIAHFYETIETDDFIYFVMEYAQKGSLLNQVKRENKLEGEYLKKIFMQLLTALYYIHDNLGIIHRDIKLENILIDANDNIKLIDFGLSCQQEKNDLFITQCGSIPFAAPEIFKGIPYSKNVDIWSAGICIYTAAVGFYPFYDNNVKNMIKKIMFQEPVFPSYLPLELIDILQKMLSKNPNKRISAKDLLNHPFFDEIRPIKFLKCDSMSVNPTPNDFDNEIVTAMERMKMNTKKIFQTGSEESTYYKISKTNKINSINERNITLLEITEIYSKKLAKTTQNTITPLCLLNKKQISVIKGPLKAIFRINKKATKIKKRATSLKL